MPAKVNKGICIGCGACCGVCPTGSLNLGADGKSECTEETCVSCGACAGTCPVEAITIE